jgi:phage head maturation protease
VDGKFYQFDEKGTAEAIKLMEASSGEKVVKAVVRGELNGETLVVRSIKEAKASKSKA